MGQRSRGNLLHCAPEVSYWEISKQYMSGQVEAVPEDGGCIVSQESLWLWEGESS
jgi:hypothetical protein